MSTPTTGAPEMALPPNPDVRHLKQQARDLLAGGGAAKLSEAQFRIARRYGFASWPKLKAHVESLQEIGRLKAAIDTEDLDTIRQLMSVNPALHGAPIGYGKNGPLTWVAECRVPYAPPSPTRLEIARWMINNGSDIHQGGDGPLMRASLNDDRIPMMELLVQHGADVNALWNGNYPILLAPCETLQPGALRWLLAHGADPQKISGDYGSPVSMLVGTYTRNPAGKHACLEMIVDAGYPLPDTAAMALHRGRLDLLDAHLRRDPNLLQRRLTEAEMFPPEIGLKPGEGLCATPIVGGTLLHLAAELTYIEAVNWLLDHGADPNRPTAVDTDGFGGQTPLFHTVITMGHKGDEIARRLLDSGADPNARCSLRKRFDWLDGPDADHVHEFRNVTPIAYAERYLVPDWANTPALVLVRARGGTAE